MRKKLAICSFIVAVTCGTSPAVVYLFDPALTSGSATFDDTLSGGVLTTVSAAVVTPNAGIWRTMNYPAYLTYASGVPHVDSASLTLDITQTVSGVPWFAATASLSQAANVNGDPAYLTSVSTSYFEGIISGVNLAASLPLLAYNVSGVVGANSGAYVILNAKTDFYDSGGFYVSSLLWNYTNTTAGAFSTVVVPTLGGPPVLTDNLMTVNSFLQLQADPSSISITPTNVPEPSAWVCLLGGLAAVAVRRRRWSLFYRSQGRVDIMNGSESGHPLA
jgi:hypothetical protein